jgi:hypothetical protein
MAEANHRRPPVLDLSVPRLVRLARRARRVKPDTVIAWHLKGFRVFWTWKIQHGQVGRPRVSREVRDLIRRMNRENPSLGRSSLSTGNY